MNPYISSEEKGALSREVHTIPKFVQDALKEHSLEKEYRSRPAYQRNDYIGWITNAKQEKTQQKRLDQMIRELKERKVYMNMKYTGK